MATRRRRVRKKRTDRRDERGQLSRKTITRLGNHFAITGTKPTLTRLTTEGQPLSWTAIYRVDGSFSWSEIQEILRSIADDTTLTEAIGGGRGTMINAEFELAGYGKKRGRFSQTEFASLSAAYELDTSLYQAAAAAEDWYNRYQGAHVIGVIFFFR